MVADLIPPPKVLRERDGDCPAVTDPTRRITSIERPETEAYRIVISPAEIALESPTAAGLQFADETLRQLRRAFPTRLPCLEIVDWPDFPVRGFYHDVTRGKVPTLATLLDLAETCAAFKLNHLELYVEHTYAFREHPEVWAGADPLTADEIRALDARCAELHIDLVPSFSTFGHFCTWIQRKFPHLNELERDASKDDFNWWDRMMHYTLDCENPESLALVAAIIREVRPLFRSRYFNICCDETFDLGNGRNRQVAAAVGKGRLYVNFLKKVIRLVEQADATPLFWGDVMRHHPELLPEIPESAILLDWDYSAELGETNCESLDRSGRSFYVCSGAQTWDRWIPAYTHARENIVGYARLGLAHRASGFLLTDWGDCGHINSLGPTLPLLALGAAAAWNCHAPALATDHFPAMASRVVFGDATGTLWGLLAESSEAQAARWTDLARTFQPRSRNVPESWFDAATGIFNGCFEQPATVHQRASSRLHELHARIEAVLEGAPDVDALLKAEIRVGLLGQRVMEEILLVLLHRAGRSPEPPVPVATVARHAGELRDGLTHVWRARNKESELGRVLAVFATAVETMQTRPDAPRRAAP